MAYKVILTPPAIEDIQRIYDYIAYTLESVINADSQISRIQEEILKLDTMPNAFRLYQREPWHSQGLRYFPVDNYLVFYMVDDDNQIVNVLRVLYGKMDLTKIWK